MLGIFKNLFASTDNSQIINAIKNGAFLVDVRTPAEFSAASVPGAVNIPLTQLFAQLSKFKGKKNIIVFCASGMRSKQAKGILEQNGIKNIINAGSYKNVIQAANQLGI